MTAKILIPTAIVLVALAILVTVMLNAPKGPPVETIPPLGDPQPTATTPAKPEETTALATFAGGCFWCTEAVFQPLKGVSKVVSGYTGGSVVNPSYEEICTGKTGHAEAIQVTYDPTVVAYADLLQVFWQTHDPTTKNRQGADVGPQYRSSVFYHTAEQKDLAERYKAKLDEAGAFGAPIVTEIVPIAEFYPAEQYHQDYYNRNKEKSYCRAVIGPKMEKLKKVFAEKLK